GIPPVGGGGPFGFGGGGLGVFRPPGVRCSPEAFLGKERRPPPLRSGGGRGGGGCEGVRSSGGQPGRVPWGGTAGRQGGTGEAAGAEAGEQVKSPEPAILLDGTWRSAAPPAGCSRSRPSAAWEAPPPAQRFRSPLHQPRHRPHRPRPGSCQQDV